jgi:type VI secretion system secreted protein VgrG
LVAISAVGLLVVSAGTAQAVQVAPSVTAATKVSLGTAETFAVLAGSGITKTGPTTIGGDVGTFPTTSISGTGSLTITGTNHRGDGVTAGAKDDLKTAYLDAQAQAQAVLPTADIGTVQLDGTLTPGVYASSSELNITGTLTLDGGGDPNAVFVFGAGSTLITASGSHVLLTGGATACNVFWQVTSSTTLGTNSSFAGNILTLQDTTLTTGATIEGSALSRDGAVTLDTNTISRPGCATPVSGVPVVVPPDVVTPVATASDSPASSSPTSSASASATTGRPTYGQVRRVPVGAVDTGDGSTAVEPHRSSAR